MLLCHPLGHDIPILRKSLAASIKGHREAEGGDMARDSVLRSPVQGQGVQRLLHKLWPRCWPAVIVGGLNKPCVTQDQESVPTDKELQVNG